VAVIFVVDDDPLVTESLGTALRLETPYVVRVFSSAEEALAALDTETPDVVLSDFKMPGFDGLKLLRAIRARCPDAVLMLLTGYADKESAISAINEVGISQYVEKPWKLDDLLLKIRGGLERQELIKTLRERNAELARANAELGAAHERLVQAERLGAVGRVVSGLAHEIGNQLALVGYAEAIKARAAGKDPDIVEFADVIVNAQKRLAAMVTEIRDFTRGQTAGVALEPADVAAVIEEALAILRWDRDVARCELRRELTARPLARLHRGKFAQVILNLVRNAAQASPPKGEITVSLGERAGLVEIVVADRGTGMAPEILARLGEPFFTTRGDRGTGLGVGICRRIVAEHGGQIAFESKPGEGTRVTITLPALAAEVAA
jgi:signal transduction histidine kinase